MKKTNYTFMVNEGSITSNGIWRRVFIDEQGRYVVKYNGKIIDVTTAKSRLVADKKTKELNYGKRF